MEESPVVNRDTPVELGATVLAVDDDPDMLDLLKKALAADDTRFLSARDGLGGLLAARENRPDLILLDVDMPGLDGFALCRRIRSELGLREVPILMLTGNEEMISYGLNNGADDYIRKPFMMEELKARVAAHLRRSRACLGVSPLTRLPGSRSIELETRRRLAAGRWFWFAHLDLRDFKRFNDRFGFRLGDLAILETAAYLREVLSDCGDREAFLGHIGGDDFALLTAAAPSVDHLQFGLRRRLRELARRRGLPDAAAMPSLYGGVVACPPGLHPDFDAVAAAAARARALAKERTHAS